MDDADDLDDVQVIEVDSEVVLEVVVDDSDDVQVIEVDLAEIDDLDEIVDHQDDDLLAHVQTIALLEENSKENHFHLTVHQDHLIDQEEKILHLLEVD